MMSALADEFTLLKEATKMYSYGADAIIIMDSTGTYLPFEVTSRIKLLKDNLPIEIGFHGHNNLNMAVINSIMAANSGATIIDACIRGFGAGAGNTPLEIMAHLYECPLLNKTKILEQCDRFKVPIPICKPINILTSKYKIMSGFEKHIVKAAEQYKISYIELTNNLGTQKLVAGQEDFIYITAKQIANNI